MRTFLAVAVALVTGLLLILLPTTGPRVAPPRHERNLSVTITPRDGARVRLAVEDLQAIESPSAQTGVARGFGLANDPAQTGVARGFGLANDPAQTSVARGFGLANEPAPGVRLPDLARLITDTLRQDLSFEGAFDLLPAAAATEGGSLAPPDGLLAGTVRASGAGLEVQLRIYKVATGEEAFARAYEAPPASARTLAHTAADEIHHRVAGVQGVARSRLAFVSDRGGTRRELGGMIRRFKEVWVADYDGTNERRVTFDGDLDLTPSWAPDRSAVAYTTFRSGRQDILVSLLNERRVGSPTRGIGSNRLPAWSPDGSRIAFASTRDGNEEIYLVNPDGSGTKRLTRHYAIDTAPAWSPDGTKIAFTSSRTGSPQIWVMNADGSAPRAITAEKYCDRPTWSPGPFNEIAYVSRTRTGFDIKVIDVASGEGRQLTFGNGFNESPAFAPNGRHIAFSSTRRGGQQIWVISRTGDNARQVTTVGNNTMPAWR